jgi:serine phosphatase RsbU (regulator of sigma subunit)
MLRTLTFFFVSLFFTGQVVGRADSLRIQLRLATSDTTKIELLTKIGDFFERTTPDSALYYYHQGVKIAQQSKIDHPVLHNQHGKLLRYIGIIHRTRGEFNKAIEYYHKAYDIFSQHEIKSGLSQVYNNFGVVYRNIGDYPKAMEYYFKALRIFEESGDLARMASCYNNIAIIYDIQKDYHGALEYYSLASEIFRQQNSLPHLGTIISNMGAAYYYLNDTEKAKEFYLNSLEYLLPYNMKPEATRVYHNLARLFSDEKKFIQAREYLDLAHGLALELNDQKSLLHILLGKAELESNMGNFSKAESLALQSLRKAKEISALDDQTTAYSLLFENAVMAANYRKAVEYVKHFIGLKDSLASFERSRLILEMEAKYQNEKKQKEIEDLQFFQELQRLELVASTAGLQRQRFIILLVLVTLGIVSIFSFQKQKQMKIIRATNLKLEAQNEEIHRKNKEIRIHRNEINAQKNVVTDQKNKIEQQNIALTRANKEILSGLRYAQRIQSSLFPDTQYLHENLGESFILFKPKSIVSGDFYWLSRKNGKVVLAAADCTGHGVAGGLLSMLGIAFLNESLHKPSLKTSAHYLDYISTRLENSLLVSEEGRQTTEGMEMTVCIVDPKALEMEFSGANSSIAIVRNNQLEIIKGDQQVIGNHSGKTLPYTSKHIQLKKGEMIYIFSDGFINQFGGPKGYRYTSSRFYKLLENISAHKPVYQKLLLEQELEKWKGSNYEQIDDILLLGFRI